MHVHTNDLVISQSNSIVRGYVLRWSRQIMGGGFYYLQYYYFVKQSRHSYEHAYKARRLPLQLDESTYKIKSRAALPFSQSMIHCVTI